MAQTIEQLTARVRELEEENARLNSEIEMLKSGKRSNIRLGMEIAASQAYAEQLREKIEALWGIIDDIDSYGDMAKADDKLFRSLVEKRQKDRWETGITTDGYVLNMPTPHSTSALDAYIAERVKIARDIDEKQIAYLFEERSALTRQRDLAIEALKWLKLIFTDSEMSQERDPELWMPTVEEAIKESGAMAQGEKP